MLALLSVGVVSRVPKIEAGADLFSGAQTLFRPSPTFSPHPGLAPQLPLRGHSHPAAKLINFQILFSCESISA